MTLKISSKRRIARVLLLIWVINLVVPSASYALTSGPVQPESKGFQPAGVSDMVDLFTGDFKYNVPLLDVDGYPVNLNYQSGSGMDDEASWVGLGWNLNVGAINRQLRGIPDDFLKDEVVTEHHTKKKVTVGGRLTAKVEKFGRVKSPGINGSITFGVFSDNYTGVGAELGANAGISFSLANSGLLTSGMGIGVMSSTSSGVDVTPYVSLSVKDNSDQNTTARAGLSASLGYNTRAGMKGLTLGSSFGISGEDSEDRTGSASFSLGGSSISYNTEPVFPRVQIPYTTDYGSFSVDAGGTFYGLFGGVGGTGYRSVRYVKSPEQKNVAYGFLYSEKGKDQKNVMMDFIREKENPVIPGIPNLALPVHTPDLFSFTSQFGSGQFRLYRGSTGVFFDNEAEDESSMSTLGTDLGFGAYFHGGVTLFEQNAKTVTRKWRSAQYQSKADFPATSLNPAEQPVFFRMVGEKNIEDADLTAQLYGTQALAVNIDDKNAFASFRNSNASSLPLVNSIRKKDRQLGRTVISFLTAAEASTSALDKGIRSFPFISSGNLTAQSSYLAQADSVPRTDNAIRKAHHISELNVTDEAGKRMVYGIPVYNLKQEEYSFAAGRRNAEYQPVDKNQLALSGSEVTHKRGTDHYFHKESIPPYASSYLLTAILSPDYQDKTGNGISNDDQGTAVRFNYSKLPYSYKWRTPYSNATLNKSMLADPDDDKGSFIYGEKELWYVNAIESKTKVAVFITEDRSDGLGVANLMGGQDATNKQKCLKEIRLYSKSDMSKPIKVVKFEYTYELCPGVPNSTKGGKLTLKKVYFQYGNIDRGKHHPYTFSYKKTVDNTVIPYGYLKTDRWGTYKSENDNQGLVDLENDEFPYAVQDKSKADENAALWQIEQVNLPTGGIIKVNYESDDYAFVQNKRAMTMTSVLAMISGSNTVVSKLKDAKGIKVEISSGAPQGLQTSWFKNHLLNGSNYLYARFNVQMSTPNSKSYGEDYDFVSAHCKVKSVFITGSTAFIQFEDINEGGLLTNPIQQAAWQRLKNEYPRYACPGYENRVKDGDASKALAAAVKAIVFAATNLSELKENFYKKAHRKSYASNVRLNKSFVRLVKEDGFKRGGGLRVKKIRISDNWQSMTADNTAPSGSYGQSYDYTRIENGKEISSGVAAYEPSIGSEENPLKQPIPYVQNIKGALNNYFSLEEPFGESFFPAASVGYSIVTVRDLDKNGNADPEQRTGFVVNEFYTAREFPVQVNSLVIKEIPRRPDKWFSLFGSASWHSETYSQGYSVELNDMHGKPGAVRVYNQSDKEISSTVYHYNAQDTRMGEKRLKNMVNVAFEDGTVKNHQIVGRDIEFFTDFREQEQINIGKTVNFGLDVIPAGFFPFPLPIPHWPSDRNTDYRMFRSACAVKVVQYYGLIDEIVKTENGSSISTENVVYDAITGEVLVTKTQNEFNQSIFFLNLPAYWIYKAMGGAYRNLGMLLANFKVSGSGTISSSYANYLQPGDEIGDLQNGKRYWVVDGNAQALQLVNRTGQLQTGLTIPFAKILRSGFKNMLIPSTASLVCLENPVENNKLRLNTAASLSSLKVLNASLNLFDEQWSVEPEPASSEGNIRYLIEDTSHSFKFCPALHVPSRGAFLEFTNANTTGELSSSDFWGNGTSGGPFTRSSIWPCSQAGAGGDHIEALSFDTCITVPQTKDYFVGCGSSNQISYRFNNGSEGNSISGFGNRWIVAKHHLTAGSHRLRITVYAGDSDPSNDYAGLEIYNNTTAELKQADVSGTAINILFSTKGIRNKADLKSARTSYQAGATTATYHHYTDQNGSPADACYSYSQAPAMRNVNPYLLGYKGNWRPFETSVYQEKRSYQNLFDPVKKGLNIKHAGAFSEFLSYWYKPAASGSVWTKNPNASNWVTANTITLYDKYGQELENRDALGRYSAAKFDFNGELPSAVASNALHREIYVASFEDSKFDAGRADRPLRELTQIATNQSVQPLTVSSEAHSGNYSLLLPATGIGLSTVAHNRHHKAESYLLFDASQGYMTKKSKGLYPSGFEPIPGKKYLISMWLKDGQGVNTKVPVNLSMNKTKISLRCRAILDGWKLVEGTIELPQQADVLDIKIVPSAAGVFADDIRIHPFDAHLKSYAYDEKSLKLMAELDENGFATFYEYDDEGSLIRVKKETERGIVTLKETRSSYRKGIIN